MTSLDAALRSNAPSSLSAVAFLQQQQRLAPRTGFGSSFINNNTGLPPLRQTVAPLPPLEENPTLFQLTEPEETMVATRNDAAGKALPIEIPHVKMGNTHVKMKKADFDSFSKEVNKKRQLEVDCAKFKDEAKKAKLAHDGSEKEKAHLEKEKAGLVTEIQQLKRELRAAGSTGGNKKKRSKKPVKIDPNARKDDRKEDVGKKITEFIKSVTYRTIKFTSVGDHLMGVTASIFEGIKDELKLEEGDDAIDVEEFCEIYSGLVLSELSNRRQYSQTRVGHASKDFYNLHGFLPTLDEMLDPWTMPETSEDATEEELAELGRKEAILLFYVDSFLPAAVGLDHWGPERRPIHLMTDKVEVNMDPSGKKKVMVTVTSEAFGLLVYENCRDAWLSIWNYKAKFGKSAKIPKYDKNNAETHVFKNKFTFSNSGQVLCGGWSKEGLDKLAEYQKHIQAFRATPEARACMEYARDLIKTRAEQELKQEEPEDKKPAAKTKTAVASIDFFEIDE